MVSTGGNLIPITEYKIFVQRANGIDFDQPVGCDGTDAAVISNRSCQIEMQTLLLAPFHLTQSSAIIAKVQAKNVIGWGALSAPTELASAAIVEVVPHKPSSTPRRDYSLSSDTLL